MKGRNRKQGWLGHVLIVLTSMVLITSWSLCGTYAKYVSDASGSSTARVAKFEVTESGGYFDDNVVLEVAVAPGEPLQREITVINKSEVAISYKISAENLTGNLPLIFPVSGRSANQDGTADSALDEALGKIPAGDTDPRVYVLNIVWDDDKRDPEYAGMTDLIKVKLEATQID